MPTASRRWCGAGAMPGSEICSKAILINVGSCAAANAAQSSIISCSRSAVCALR
jgi:hypothetical protein